MTERVAQIAMIARRPDWPLIKTAGQVIIQHGEHELVVDLVQQQTQIGSLRYLACPRCGTARRELYAVGGQIGCRGCFGLRYAHQRLTRSAREFCGPALRIARIDRHLEGAGLDRNARRRLRRRRSKLLLKLQRAFEQRQERRRAKVAEIDCLSAGPSQ